MDNNYCSAKTDEVLSNLTNAAKKNWTVNILKNHSCTYNMERSTSQLQNYLITLVSISSG